MRVAEVDPLIGLADRSGHFANYQCRRNLALIVANGCASLQFSLLNWNYWLWGENHSLEIYTLPRIYILLWVWYSVIQIYLFRYLLLWFRYPVSHKVKDCSFPTVAPSFVGGGNRLSWSCFGIIRIDHLGTMNACKVCANPQLRYGVTKTPTVNFRISKDNQIQ